MVSIASMTVVTVTIVTIKIVMGHIGNRIRSTIIELQRLNPYQKIIVKKLTKGSLPL